MKSMIKYNQLAEEVAGSPFFSNDHLQSYHSGYNRVRFKRQEGVIAMNRRKHKRRSSQRRLPSSNKLPQKWQFVQMQELITASGIERMTHALQATQDTFVAATER